MTVTPEVYRPYGGAKELFYAQDKLLLFVGVAGGGKTRSVVEKCNLLCEVFPGTRILWVRQTRASLAESVLTIYEEEVMDARARAEILGKDPPDRANRTRPYVYPPAINQYEGKTYRGRSRIVLGGLDKVEKTFSAAYDVIVVFEAREVMSIDVIEKLQRALRNFVVPFQQLILDTNPGSEHHPIYKMVTAPDSPWRVITSLHRDNPVYYDHDKGEWTAKGLDYVEGTLANLTGSRKKQLYLGQWCSEEGRVWDSWDGAVHMFSGVLQERNRYWRIEVQWPDSNRIGVKKPGAQHEDPSYVELRGAFGSIDWGYRAPGSFSVYGQDADRNLYRIAHIYHSERLIDWWAEEILKLCEQFKVWSIVADPARPDNIDLLNDMFGPRAGRDGKRVIRPASNDFMSGRDLVDQALRPADGSPPKIHFMRGARVHPADPKLVDARIPTCFEEEVDGYVWKTFVDGKPLKEEPKKEHDHGCDEVRYACAYHWGKDVKAKIPPVPPNPKALMTVLTTHNPNRRKLATRLAASGREFMDV